MSAMPTPEQFHAWVDLRLIWPVLHAVHGHFDQMAVRRACGLPLLDDLRARPWPTRERPTELRTWIYRRSSALEVSGTFGMAERREPIAARVTRHEGRLVVCEFEVREFRHLHRPAAQLPRRAI